MTKRTIALVGLLAVSGLNVLARQSSLAKVGVTLKDIQTWAMATIYESTAADGVWLMQQTPGPTPAAAKAIQAMTPAERIALTQEVLAAVKAAVMAPAFRAQHTAKIKETKSAIDHGVNAETFGMTGNLEADTITTTVVPIIQMLRTFPDAALKEAFESERVELAETIKTETGDERAKAQKDLARLNALAPLIASNPAEFKKQYTLAKSASMGGPDTEAKLQAATATGQEKEKMRQEQISWNRYNLNAIVRKNLTNFIDDAGRFDFKRQTVMRDGTLYWSDGAEMYGLTVLEHLMGQATTAAAVQFARAWLKELQ